MRRARYRRQHGWSGQPKGQFARQLRIEPLETRALLSADGVSTTVSDAVPVVGFTVQTLLPGTETPVTEILVGRELEMQILVQDLRDDEAPFRGIFATYTDLLYDKTLARFRVPEIQTLNFSSSTPTSGSFTLTLNPGQTTAPINYTRGSTSANAANVALLQTALNNLLGPGSVEVAQVSVLARYEIRFIGEIDIDQPLLQASLAGVTVSETFKGDPSLPASFTEAFRSRGGTFQDGFSAINATDSPSRVDELGGISVVAQGSGQVELARARVRAILPPNQTTGNLVFAPNFDDIVYPDHATLVFAANQNDKSTVSPQEISATPATIIIHRALVGTAGSAVIDEDNASGINISILPLVTKSVIAPAGAVELRDFSQPASGGTVTRLDPNNTPNDRSDDQVKFVPAHDFNGVATFTYTAGIVGDNFAEDTVTQTISVTVNAVNDRPVNTIPGSRVTQEDTALVFSAATGSSVSVLDVDSGLNAIQVAVTVTNGTLSLNQTAGLAFTAGDGTADASMVFTAPIAAVNAALANLTFNPTSNLNGTATFSIATSDRGNTGSIAGVALEDQDSVSITVAAANDAPTLSVPATQTFYSINTLVFSPAFGNAITVADVDAASDQMLVSVGVNGGIGTLSAVAAPGAVVTDNGPANLSISGSQAAINATLSGLTLTPASPLAATGTLTIFANDQGHNPGPPLTKQATLAVNILVAVGPFAVNDAPANLIEGSSSYTIDVLANDLRNPGSLPIIVSFTQPTKGSLTLLDNGNADPTDDKLLFLPPPKNGQFDLDFFTPASVPPITFSYVINESPGTGLNNSPPATVAIRISNVADVPVAASDGAPGPNYYATSAGVALLRNAAQGLLVNDTVIDNNYLDANVATLTVLGVTPGSQAIIPTAGGGVAAVNTDGSFLYAPGPQFIGDDTFTYQAHSSLGPNSSPTTVTIHVSPPPTVDDDSYTSAQEDQPFTSATSVLSNDGDSAESEPLSAVLVTNVPSEAGSVTLAATGIFTFTPTPHFSTTRPTSSPITFTYKVTTPSGRESSPSDLATVSITVNETNDNPTATDDTFRAVARKGPLGIDQVVSVLNNDSHAPDIGETLSVTAINGAIADSAGNSNPIGTTGGGSVRLENFQIKYTSPNASGDDSITYTISDGRGGTATATVHIHIIPPYDYGDAPDSYGTTFESDGVRHVAVGPRLGTAPDEEADGQPSSAATNDDQAGSDDEDGVPSYSLLRGKSSSVSVAIANASLGARLDAWIDYNQDGIFAPAERISLNTSVTSGTAQIVIVPPADALLGPTIARFRVSSAGNLGPTGVAADGEIEDHTVILKQDLTVNLPTGNGLDLVSIRRNGENVEVVDVQTSAPIATSPLEFTNSFIVNGSATEPDIVTVDYSLGGFFALPAGIRADGGASDGDLLTVVGSNTGGTAVRFISQNLPAGNGTLETQDGAAQNNVQFTNFEPLTISGVASIELIGTVNLGSESLILASASPVKLGSLTTLDGGGIHALSGVSLAADQTLRGHGAVIGRISGEAGSTIEATGPLILGDAASPDGFATLGELKTNGNTVKLADANQVVLGSQTELGAAGVAGTLESPNGILLNAGNQITGFGTLSTPNDALQSVVNNGAITGTSAAEPITLPGYVTGIGTLDNVTVTGTLSPGASPASVNYGNVNFSSTSKLIVEIGGTSAGDAYDQLSFSGGVSLSGNLTIVLIGAFAPQFDESFTPLSAAAGISGAFSTVDLPPVGIVLPNTTKDRKWSLPTVAGAIRLDIVTTRPWYHRQFPLDVDGDEAVSASDSLDIINYINGKRPTAVDPDALLGRPFGFLDTDGDNNVSPSDALGVINYINAHRDGEGEASSAAASASEPASDPLAEIIDLLAGDAAEAAQRKRRIR